MEKIYFFYYLFKYLFNLCVSTITKNFNIECKFLVKMDAIQLLAKLQIVPKDNYDKIVRLIQTHKSVFDRPGLSPNAIDCIDNVVTNAELIRRGSEDEAYYRILMTYNIFLTVVGAVERRDYWSNLNTRKARPRTRHDDTSILARPKTVAHHIPSKMVQPTNNTTELQAIRQVFDIYVTAKLMQHGMSKYPERLGLYSLI